MSLPAEVSFGTITGRWLRAVVDGSDVDRDPEGLPVEGLTVTFKPSVARVRYLGAVPATIGLDSITAQTDTSGVLVGPDGAPGVRLVATDDPDLVPSGFTYTVTMSAPSFSSYQFNITVPGGSTKDLTMLDPGVPVSGGSQPAPVRSVAGLSGDVAAEPLADVLAPFLPSGGGGVCPDATDTVKGVLRLAGHLGGTADSPTVPGLAGKVDATDARLSDARTPLAHTHPQSDVTGLDTALSGKSNVGHTHSQSDVTGLDATLAGLAPLASPSFTGNPLVPTQAPGNNSTRAASTAFVAAALAGLVDAAPGTLDTLNELAAALGDDPNFASTIMAAVGAKLDTAAAAELIRDTIATALVAGSGVTVTPNDPGDTITIAATGGSGISPTLVDAKGDLIVATGNDTVARLGVGSAGQVLTPDPATATGLKWATPAAGGGLLAIANSRNDNLYSAGVASWAMTPSSTGIGLTPVFLPAGSPITRLIVRVHAAATVSKMFELCIYDMQGTLLTAATGSTGTTVGTKEVVLPSPVTLPPGMFWFGLKIRDTADSTLRFNAAILGPESAYVSRGNPWDPIDGPIRSISAPHAGTGAVPASIAGITLVEGGGGVGFAWRVA